MRLPYTKSRSEWKHHQYYIIHPFGLQKTGLVDTEIVVKKELRTKYFGWSRFGITLARESYYAVYCNLRFKSGQTYCSYMLVQNDVDLKQVANVLYITSLKVMGLTK